MFFKIQILTNYQIVQFTKETLVTNWYFETYRVITEGATRHS